MERFATPSAAYYTLDADGQPVSVTDRKTWADWFSIADRRVAFDAIDGIKVSTVFLGIDHQLSNDGPPLLFETIIFAPEGHSLKDRMWRYSTRDYALIGHQRAVELVTREKEINSNNSTAENNPCP
jgi:hypothetical protein